MCQGSTGESDLSYFNLSFFSFVLPKAHRLHQLGRRKLLVILIRQPGRHTCNNCLRFIHCQPKHDNFQTFKVFLHKPCEEKKHVDCICRDTDDTEILGYLSNWWWIIDIGKLMHLKYKMKNVGQVAGHTNCTGWQDHLMIFYIIRTYCKWENWSDGDSYFEWTG